MKNKIQFDGSLARSYRKKSQVLAFKSNDPIVFHKSWGDQKLRSEGWVMVSLTEDGEANGDIYGCDAAVFANTYEPASENDPNLYRKSELIRAYQPGHAFTVDTVLEDGHTEVESAHTEADDAWFVQAPNGELYIIENVEFERIYVQVD